MSIKQKIQKDNRMQCFERERPEAMSITEWERAKAYAVRIGKRLSKEQEASAFYFFYMGSTFKEISEKLGVLEDCILYSAVYYSWHERRRLAANVRAGEKVTKADAAAIDLLSDSIVATAAIYKSAISEALSDPTKAKDCPFIPKNFKDLKILMELLQSFQSKEVPNSKFSVSNNIVNLPNNGNNINSQAPYARDAEVIEAEEYSSLEAGNKQDLMKYLRGEKSEIKTNK